MYQTTSRRFGLLLAAILATAACSSGSDSVEEATGEGSIRAIHAIADLGQVQFLIEETALANVDFQEVSGISEYDDLTYAFNFDILLPDDSDYTRLATEEVSVVADREYTFALTGSLDAPEIRLWEQTTRDWADEIETAEDNDTAVTVLEVSFGHLAAATGAVDVYLSTPGTTPLAGNEAASLSFGALQTAIEYPAGDYQVVITPDGDPDTLLFASDPIFLDAAISVNIVVMDEDNRGASFSVRVIGSGSSTTLVDINAEATLRAVHGAFSTETLDIVAGDNFDDPLIAALEFGVRSSRISIPDGELSLNITPTGVTSVFLEETTATIARGSGYTLYLHGLPGELDGVFLTDVTRPLITHARLRAYQAAARFGSLDLYVIEAGSDIALLSARVPSLAYTGATGYLSVVPGDYELVFTSPGTKTIVAGPFATQLDALGVYDVVAVDGVQTDRAEILFYVDD